jgi:hypothetical protein
MTSERPRNPTAGRLNQFAWRTQFMNLNGEENGMKVDGGCHCGQITFEAEVDPERPDEL